MPADDEVKLAIRAYRNAYPHAKPSVLTSFFEGDTKKPEEFVLLITNSEHASTEQPTLQGSGPTIEAAGQALRKNLSAWLRKKHASEQKALQELCARSEAFHARLLASADELDPPAAPTP